MHIIKDKGELQVIAIALVYTILMSIFTCLRHEVFKTGAYDLGIFMQSLWTTIYAKKFFYETPDLGITLSGSFFGVHFSPVMFFLLILYWMLPHPYTLLCFQSFLLGFAAIPIYKLAREILKKEDIAKVFAMAYLIYPLTLAANLYDFHLEAFFPIIFSYALYYLERKNFLKFYLMVFLSLFILDFASIFFALAILLYASVIRYRYELISWIRTRKLDRYVKKHLLCCIVMMIITLMYFAVAMYIIEIFGVKPFSKTQNWPDLGSNIYEMILGLLNPKKIITAIMYDFITKILWLAIIVLFPLLFLPLFAPFELFPFYVWILVAFLSRYPPYYQLGYQYGAIYTSFVFFAAIHGYMKLVSVSINSGNKWRFWVSKVLSSCRKITNYFRFLIIITSIMIVLFASVTPCIHKVFMGPAFSRGIPFPDSHTLKLKQILSLIPDNASVLAQNNIFPHVAHRVNAYVWVPLNSTDIIEYAIGDLTYFDFFDYIPNEGIRYSDIFSAIFSSGKYGVLAEADGIILLKKNYFGKPVIYEPMVKFFNYQNIMTRSGKIGYDYESLSKYVLIFDNVSRNSCLWYGAYVRIPPGRFEITLRLKIIIPHEIPGNSTLLRVDIFSHITQKKIASYDVYAWNIENNSWIEIRYYFKIKSPEILEIIGFSEFESIRVLLDYIRICQLHYLPE